MGISTVDTAHSPDLSTACGEDLVDNFVMSVLHIYADESCTSGNRYLALGGIALEAAFVETVLARLKAVREAHKTHGEVKWQKVSKTKLDFYKAYVDVFFNAAKDDDIHFYALYVDTWTFNHGRYNGGKAEIGFNKLIYQLLLHKFGRKYGANYLLHVFLDDRSTRHDPEDLRPMLNHDLAKWDIHGRPFRQLRFRDSKKCDLIQLNDLLLGTVGFKRNLHDKIAGCAPHKVKLAEHVVRRALENEKPHRLNSPQAKRFAVWPFKYRGG
jgi:Protein of unknown function (DUF3800)